jgi:hypothetical protein
MYKVISESSNRTAGSSEHHLVVVKTTGEPHSVNNAASALASHHALSTDLAVKAEAIDRLVDQVDKLLVGDVVDVGGV